MSSDGEITCPSCGLECTFQELAYRWTFQNVRLDESGEPIDWDSFDYSDEVYMVGVACVECDACWPTYGDLQAAIKGLPHAIGQAEITFNQEGIPNA